MINPLRSLLFSTLVMATVALATVRPVVAQSKGADIVKNTSSQTYDVTYGCYRYTTDWNYRWQDVLTSSKIEQYQFKGDGSFHFFNLCLASVESSGDWATHGHIVWKDSLATVYNYGGKGGGVDYNGKPYSYHYTLTFANGELRVGHFWYNGEKIW